MENNYPFLNQSGASVLVSGEILLYPFRVGYDGSRVYGVLLSEIVHILNESGMDTNIRLI